MLLRQLNRSSVTIDLELFEGLGPPLLKLCVLQQSHSTNLMVFPKFNLQTGDAASK